MATKNTKVHKIGWLNIPGYIPQTWNSIVGCSKVSEGCRKCYAESMARRLRAMNVDGYLEATKPENDGGGWNGKTFLLEDALQKPLGWKKPRAIFVNSMGDLFHENTPDEWINRVFAVMALCPQHLFIVLTKRAWLMESYFNDGSRRNIAVYNEATKLIGGDFSKMPGDMASTRSSGGTWWPLPNVWLGVTAENQAAADERIPHLLSTPAAVRFVSCEPMIGPVDLAAFVPPFKDCNHYDGGCVRPENVFACTEKPSSRAGIESCRPSYCVFGRKGLDWIIYGGESGPSARPMHPEWARSLRDQAQSAGVPSFFKQWGDCFAGKYALPGYSEAQQAGLNRFNKHGGDVLDGRQWHQWPACGCRVATQRAAHAEVQK